MTDLINFIGNVGPFLTGLHMLGSGSSSKNPATAPASAPALPVAPAPALPVAPSFTTSGNKSGTTNENAGAFAKGMENFIVLKAILKSVRLQRLRKPFRL